MWNYHIQIKISNKNWPFSRSRSEFFKRDTTLRFCQPPSEPRNQPTTKKQRPKLTGWQQNFPKLTFTESLANIQYRKKNVEEKSSTLAYWKLLRKKIIQLQCNLEPETLHNSRKSSKWEQPTLSELFLKSIDPNFWCHIHRNLHIYTASKKSSHTI